MALIEEQEETKDGTLKDELDLKARLQLRQLISILRQREASENVPLGKPLDEMAVGAEPTGMMPVFGEGVGKIRNPKHEIRNKFKTRNSNDRNGRGRESGCLPFHMYLPTFT
jgi:hypothetical protein